MGHLLNPVQGSDVIKRVDTRGQSTVQAEDLVLDEGGEGEVVEQIGKVLPHVGIAILAQALVVEAIYLGDLARLVITAEDGDPRRISNLEGHEKRDGLNGVVASVDIITCTIRC